MAGITEVLQTQLQNQFFSGAVGAGLLLGAVAYLRNIPFQIWERIKPLMTVSLTIHSRDELYDPMFRWLEKNRFDMLGKRYRLRTEDHEEGRKKGVGPDYGTHYFRFNKKWVRVYVRQDEKTMDGSHKQTNDFITVSYMGFSKATLEAVIRAIELLGKSDDESVRIMPILNVYEGPAYGKPFRLPRNREVDVVLNNGDLEAIELDIQRFLDRKDWYAERQIPYRRGYLLEGPPGTGKSTLVKHIAVKFGMDVYVPNKGSALQLDRFVRHIPPRSILLFEDVDAIYKKRKETEDLAEVVSEVMTDFSAVLNALDGLTSAEDLMIVMTTNHPDRLDPALVRPGRIDYRLTVGLCTSDQASSLFKLFYPSSLVAEEFGRAAGGASKSPADIKRVLIMSSTPEDALTILQNEVTP